MLKKNPLFIFFLILVFCSCKNNKIKNSNGNAFLGGEIINRTSNYIVLKHNKKFIDSIVLNSNNRFEYTIKDAKAGLYYFHHGKEFQSILIEPGDSLMIRLNTYDFDESIAFGGKGSKENNYLMRLFLENEKEVKGTILNYSQLKPELFQKKINTLRDKKLELLKIFNLKNNTSKLFQEIALANINYNYYNAKEFYPFANYRKNELEIFNTIPKDFYSYRKTINYNNVMLENYIPYNSFLRFHINNIALKKHFDHSNESNYNEYSLDYNLDKLNIVDSLIKNESIKNALLNYNTIMFINGSQNTLDYEPILNSFIEKNSDKKQIRKAKQLVKTYQRLRPGEPIPNLVLLNSKDEEVSISRLIKRPTIIYFWNVKSKSHLIDSHKRIKKLRLKHPEFDYMAISTNDISSQEQHQILKRLNLVNVNEYRFKTPNEAIKTLAIKPINNVFLVDKDANIINPKANIFNIHFDQLLFEHAIK